MIDAVTYGMIPSANRANCDERAAREDVQQAEDGSALLVEVFLDLLRVDARVPESSCQGDRTRGSSP